MSTIRLIIYLNPWYMGIPFIHYCTTTEKKSNIDFCCKGNPQYLGIPFIHQNTAVLPERKSKICSPCNRKHLCHLQPSCWRIRNGYVSMGENIIVIAIIWSSMLHTLGQGDNGLALFFVSAVISTDLLTYPLVV